MAGQIAIIASIYYSAGSVRVLVRFNALCLAKVGPLTARDSLSLPACSSKPRPVFMFNSTQQTRQPQERSYYVVIFLLDSPFAAL